MNKMLIPILFAIGTALFWGCYGPTIGNAQAPRVDGRPLMPPEGWSPFKPYVFIGIAYIVVSVIGGLIMMKVKGDSFSYSEPVAGVEGVTHFLPAKWGFLAGTLGACGAFCLTTAMMTSRGNALLVMPIVFGGAISVMAVVSVLKLHEDVQISPMLWVGMGITVLGVVTTAMNTPHGHAPSKPGGGGHAAVEQAAGADAATQAEPATAETS
jgi:drug/metabolite transporter (DMT)-like permease